MKYFKYIIPLVIVQTIVFLMAIFLLLGAVGRGPAAYAVMYYLPKLPLSLMFLYLLPLDALGLVQIGSDPFGKDFWIELLVVYIFYTCICVLIGIIAGNVIGRRSSAIKGSSMQE